VEFVPPGRNVPISGCTLRSGCAPQYLKKRRGTILGYPRTGQGLLPWHAGNDE